jgi:hypothetical protein
MSLDNLLQQAQDETKKWWEECMLLKSDLLKLEWFDKRDYKESREEARYDGLYKICPACREYKRNGHKEDCWLNERLRG